MVEPLFLKSIFQEKIWDGERLDSVFDFNLTSQNIGENWATSAHPHGTNIVENGKLKGGKIR